MIYIEKGFPPAELVQAKRRGLKDYDEMTSDTKDAIKRQLLKEQFHLCAYCMRRIKLDSMQIEHYIAQHPSDKEYNAALTIDYHNMLGVCPGGEGEFHKYEHFTCDQHRGNIPLTVDPLDMRTIAKIKYSQSGAIDSDDLAIKKDLCKTLNLNCVESRLKENRKATLDALKKWIKGRYKDKHISKEEWQSVYHHYCESQNGKKEEYIGIIVWYLQKKMQSAT